MHKVNNMQSVDMPKTTKTLTCSMTRANKILTKLKEMSNNKTSMNRRGKYYTEPPITYSVEISFLTNRQNHVEKDLEQIRSAYNQVKLRKNLIEKIKNRIFVLNIRYGIHELLSEIDLLKHERTCLSDILDEYKRKKCRTLEDIKYTMDILKNDDKKYEYKWCVSAFDADELQDQIKNISKKISQLDDKRDTINISSTFSIDLSSDEYSLLELDE